MPKRPKITATAKKQTRKPMTRDEIERLYFSRQQIAKTEAMYLAWDAYNNDVEALEALVNVGRCVATLLETLIEEKPELCVSVARRFSVWPVGLNRDPKAQREVARQLKKLEVGADVFGVGDSVSRFDLEDSFTYTAKALYWELIRAAYKYLDLQDSKPKSCLQLPAYYKQAVALLPKDITMESVEDWWRVAKQIWDEGGYPADKHRKASLMKLAASRFHKDDKTRRTPGRLRAKALEILRSRFLSLAKKHRDT